MSDAPTIRARGVEKAYGDKHALAGADLDVARGSIVGFVGPNGAGKTTLLRALVGLVLRDGGDIAVLGHDPRSDSLAIRADCSYLPGETSLYHTMRAREFLDFALKFYPRRRTALIDEMIERFELPMHRHVRALSAGMKQKLALIAALGPDVSLYVLDEPDRALDASVRMVLRELLGRLREAGASVLFSSHHLAEVEAVSDATTFIIEGRTVPTERVTAARDRLRERLRLTLSEPVDLPDDLDVREMPDGSLEIHGLDDPVALLASLPHEAIRSAELGATRLEDLYQELMG